MAIMFRPFDFIAPNMIMAIVFRPFDFIAPRVRFQSFANEAPPCLYACPKASTCHNN